MSRWLATSITAGTCSPGSGRRFEPLEVLRALALEKLRGVEPVGAPRRAVAALDALVHLCEALLPLRLAELFARHPVHEKPYPGGHGNGDVRWTGEAVAAGPAEVAGELRPCGAEFFAQVVSEGGRLGLEPQELLELVELLDAPYGDHVAAVPQAREGEPGIVEEASTESLHCDEADVVFGTEVGELEILTGGYDTERKLQRIVEARLHRGSRGLAAVIRYADEPGQAALPCFDEPCVGGVRVIRVRQRLRVVELEHVHVVGLHPTQALLDLRDDLSPVRGPRALGGDKETIAEVRQRVADLLLAVRIPARCIKEVDTRLHRPPENGPRRVEIDALQGQHAKARAGDHEIRPSKSRRIHRS